VSLCYLLRRLLQVVPAVAGIVLLAFVVIHTAPGDPAVALGGEHGDEAYYARVAWWMALFPGAVIALAVLGLNLLGDGLNDLLDP
jgi:peptide/nickel transport system permease protein